MITQNKIISLDHMTHIDNVDTIFKYGLYSHHNPYKKIDISNMYVNARRNKRENIYGKKIHDYVPFYFNPRNAMMYRNKDKNIIILAFNSTLLKEQKMLFTNKNASTDSVHFYNNIKKLDDVRWNDVKSKSWYNKSEEVKQIMMAEVLIPNNVDIKHMVNIYCKNFQQKKYLMNQYNLSESKIIINSNLFFK